MYKSILHLMQQQILNFLGKKTPTLNQKDSSMNHQQ